MSTSSFVGEISGKYFGLRCDDNFETQKSICFELGDFICDGGEIVNSLRHRNPPLFTIDRNAPPSLRVYPASAWGGWLVVRSADWELFLFHYKETRTAFEDYNRIVREHNTIEKFKRRSRFS